MKKRNSYGRTILMIFAFVCAVSAKAQTFGNWVDFAGTGINDKTQTLSAVGIGIGPWTGTTPESWTHIKWCPPFTGADQAGLILTMKKCTNNVYLLNPNHDRILIPDLNNSYYEPSVVPSLIYTSNLPVGTYVTPSNPFTSYISGVNGGREPLLWARTEEAPIFSSPAAIESQFIVMPNGHTGINVSAPRAALDVRAAGGLNTPSAIFGSHAMRGYITPSNPVPGVFYRHSRHISMVPLLGLGGYNNISLKGDIGMIFTDGLGTDGANTAGALVIAPWSSSSSAGGLRMEANGNTELRGNLRCVRVTVNAKWWPDYVFAPTYKLMQLSEVQEYIKINKRLPGMPSQDSVVAGGQDVGQIQVLQQQKIEELTLYAIQQNETIKSQEAQLTEQRLSILAQELRLKKIEDSLKNK